MPLINKSQEGERIEESVFDDQTHTHTKKTSIFRKRRCLQKRDEKREKERKQKMIKQNVKENLNEEKIKRAKCSC